MSIDLIVRKRFAELETQINALRTDADDLGLPVYRPEDWQQWASSALHLLQNVFGNNTSPHYRNFTMVYDRCVGRKEEIQELKGIFRGAKADYDGGYAFSLPTVISGEIYGDFILLAKKALDEGFKDVAAVLASAALEDALKRFAQMNELDVTGKAMQEVVGALKSRGLVGGAQKSLLDAMPRIRDYSMHANWDKITPQDVGSVIGFVEQLLLTKFS